MRDEYDWEFQVDQYGNESSCTCPIVIRFREKMGTMLRLWASTKPDTIWINDDLRLHNHGLADKKLDYYCYRQNHLDAFAGYSERRFTRQVLLDLKEELIPEILRPGTPSETL